MECSKQRECVRVYLRGLRCSLVPPDFQSVPSVWRTQWIILLPTSPSLPPSLLLSLCLSDTFPLSSVPLRGPVTQQSLNHRFEVSLLCLETRKIGQEVKSKTDPGSTDEGISAVVLNAVLHYQQAPLPPLNSRPLITRLGPCNDIVWYQMPHQGLTCNREVPHLVTQHNCTSAACVAKTAWLILEQLHESILSIFKETMNTDWLTPYTF